MKKRSPRVTKTVPPPKYAPRTKYPWETMGSGDSIWVSAKDDPKGSNGKAVNAARLWLRKHRPGWKVIARSEKGGARVWVVDPATQARPRGGRT